MRAKRAAACHSHCTKPSAPLRTLTKGFAVQGRRWKVLLASQNEKLPDGDSADFLAQRSPAFCATREPASGRGICKVRNAEVIMALRLLFVQSTTLRQLRLSVHYSARQSDSEVPGQRKAVICGGCGEEANHSNSIKRLETSTSVHLLPKDHTVHRKRFWRPQSSEMA